MTPRPSQTDPGSSVAVMSGSVDCDATGGAASGSGSVGRRYGEQQLLASWRLLAAVAASSSSSCYRAADLVWYVYVALLCVFVLPVAEYVDLPTVRWYAWLLWPLFALLIIPASILLLLFLSAFFLECYRHWHGLRAAYEHSIWDGARYVVAMCWKVHGRLWHGYEVCGLENIPAEGGVMIVFYHGAIPIDYYYLIATELTMRGRLIKTVGDRFLYKIPGWEQLMRVFSVIPGGQWPCVAALRAGDVVGISPGGVREAFFGQNYQLVWRDRLGFARVAIEAKVPVVPMFTRNVRESYRAFTVGRRFWSWLYERTRLPLVPIYGGFPVKMRTYLGAPIPYQSDTTPHQLVLKVSQAINLLIEQHQPRPGSVLRGLVERLVEPAAPLSKLD